jgi:hypothetical protein
MRVARLTPPMIPSIAATSWPLALRRLLAGLRKAADPSASHLSVPGAAADRGAVYQALIGWKFQVGTMGAYRGSRRSQERNWSARFRWRVTK